MVGAAVAALGAGLGTGVTRAVGFLVYPGFQILDLGGPLAAFQVAARAAPELAARAAPDVASEPAYRLRVVSAGGGAVASSSGLAVVTEAIDDAPLDTLVVVGGVMGGAGVDGPAITAELAAIVRARAAATRRIAGVCTGAFILAEAGLLDGRCATTHWLHAALLQRRYPRVRVEGDRIFARDGAVWTSAGISAGIDLALALVEDDLGPAVSRAAARTLVVYHRRPGGQSQFSALLDLDPASDRFRTVLAYAREHLGERLTTERLAEVACLSPRQFARAFAAETGETPAKAVERLRAEAARGRIEGGSEPIEAIARAVGFGDPERMRRAFLRLYGHPPQGIRRLSRAA